MTEFSTGLAKGDNGYEAGKKAAEKALENFDKEISDIAFVFSSSDYDYEKVIEGVKEFSEVEKIFGCSSAGEFNEDGYISGGVGVAVLSSDSIDFHRGIGKKMSEDVVDSLEEAASDFPDEADDREKSVINLHDGLRGMGKKATWKTLEVCGSDVKVGGGAAGDNMEFKETHVFDEDEIVSDGVNLGMLVSDKPVILSVDHGHETISPPLRATKTEGNVVHELNGEPAFDVYKSYIKEDYKDHLGVDLDDVEVGTKEWQYLIVNYELGVHGNKVRWPGLTEDESGPMVFACDIPENSVLQVMVGWDKEKHIEAARKTAKRAKKKAKDKGIDIAGALVFECGVRKFVLQERFGESVETVSEELDVPLLGFETFGEICIGENEVNGFHNTTTVIMLLPEA